ncbi:DUF1573 domain-containing protein [Pseudoflavitalea sp. X16]|uniref:DUF1573 domain-containing protein n=1 Tax=Paraflavitalea devenefica TaxID=2716334 RepID=UPI001421C4DC|nr:DUF1573 domain-containing protein [Paraflavitalea devenefica]NII26739.1 DUF1573 domain-containing protein [Paraflavitalea devenefica]
MKTLFFSLLVALTAWSCSNSGASEPPKPGETTTIQWIDSAKDMGKVLDGQVVDIVFRFKNTGAKQLVIKNVGASCGCTVAERPEAPIAPGKEGEIKATFNSKGRLGTNKKTLTVYANTGGDETHKLYFTVEVMPAADTPKN